MNKQETGNQLHDFTINYERVKSIEDAVAIFKAVNYKLTFDAANPPEQFRDLIDRDLLVGVPMGEGKSDR